METLMRHIIRLLTLITVVLAPGLFSAALAVANELAKPLPADVRVIIDISGSMKKTDPQNLRKPAVDLIVRLLPDNSKAGLWTFGQSVNMLMPHRVVDPQWRSEGTQKATSINSVAMFTNIGAALEKATEDYATPAKDYRRNIILLTDGVVDVSKEAVVNLNERKRILTELLPRLKASDYRIHTIALSADADHELMKKLSLATDGIFEVAETADELMSTFLRIFDQAVPAERVPLDENGFLVDASIQEFTALIFRRAEVPATIIVAPDGKEYSDTDPSNNVNWYRTSKYDLITVQKPVSGQWKVKTDMDPGSRVTVVSNLQLVVQPLKSNIRPNQSLGLVYSFQENNQTITNKDFLGLLTGKALIANPSSHEVTEIELANTVPADGIFQQELNGFTGQGEYDVTLVIDGKTFKREFIHHLNITDSAFKLEKSQSEQAGKKTWSYRLVADLESVDVANTHVTAKIKNSKEKNLEQKLNTIAKEYWEFSFAPVQAAKYEIELQVEGKQIDGSPLSEIIKADQFYFPDEATVSAEVQPKPTQIEPAASEPEVAVEPEEPAAEPAENNPSNLWLYLGLGIGNLIVVLLGYFAYRLISGKGSKDELAEIEKTLTTDTASLKKDPDKKTTIDVADDETAHIPMEESSPPEMTMPDDLMADNLFPLDNMDDSDGDKK
ncbi:VWA domain-containing protein [Cellvibrio sp. OA-2007]|uniref:VWA domain-containing protein n=1 Tax=Cellvibrio sp. OA-2007 TaxID=529823 RepID=UPI000784E4D1|nr:VWA domain-containing protein [Cellvibrio sp. OA-2007]